MIMQAEVGNTKARKKRREGKDIHSDPTPSADDLMGQALKKHLHAKL